MICVTILPVSTQTRRQGAKCYPGPAVNNTKMIYERRVETCRARQAMLNEDVAGRHLRELSGS